VLRFAPGILVIIAAASGCAPAGNPMPTAAAVPETAAPSRTLPGSVTASPTPADWATFMGDSARTGDGPSSPVAGTPRRTWSVRVDGGVSAQPLVSGLSVIIATENDTLYSLEATTGAERWRNHLGDPVPLSRLQCGNIDPNGITSTPVIDTVAGVVYAVAMLNTVPLRHELFAVRLSDGATLWHRLIDPPKQYAGEHQQRGALNLSGDRIYVSYGGFAGDCGDYHGWVIASSIDGKSPLLSWQVPSGLHAAIWAPPGPVISPTGDVWVSTGNSDATSGAWDGGNGVIRLDPARTRPIDEWASKNWAVLKMGDVDLGSGSPALLPGDLVLGVGKEGVGYLLRQHHLGGVGGEVFSAPVCNGGPTAGAFGGPAIAGDMVYVPCKEGLTAIRVNAATPSFTVVWRAAPGANTPTLAYGLVWTVAADPSGYRDSWNGTLVGLDPATGQERAHLSLGPVPHFVSPSATGGALYVGGAGVIYAISPT
jgi:outer membrane protein assembly factor BamB